MGNLPTCEGPSPRYLREPLLLTTAQVARRLSTPVRTVRYWAELWLSTGGTDGIPGFKVRRQWRYDPAEIENWLKNKRCPLSVFGIAQPIDQRSRPLLKNLEILNTTADLTKAYLPTSKRQESL